MWLVVIVALLASASNSVAQTAEAVAQAEAAAKAAQTEADKLAAEKAVLDKALAEKTAAAKATAEQAVAAKAAADKSAAEKAAAEKAAAEKAAAAKAAAEKAAAAQAALVRAHAEKIANDSANAQMAASNAVIAKATADQTLQQKVAAVNTASPAAAAAKAAADKANAEAAAAKAALDKAGAAEKAAAEKSFAEKTAAAKAATEKAAAAQQALDKANAERVAAEQAIPQKVAALRAAVAQWAAARAVHWGGLKPLDHNAWDYNKAKHLLSRAGFGGTPEDVTRLHAMGLHDAIDYLVNYQKHSIAEIPVDAALPERPDPIEGRLSEEERNRINTRRQEIENRQVQRVREWWLRRMVESQRPLQEKLVLFWHGHFACEYEKVLHSYAMYQQNQLFREHANGNFGALLNGIIRDPTMLRYLDNNINYKGHANENLAREIMELFSMGVGNYTEKDIREAARALTGYTYEHYTSQFRFIRGNHDETNKTIFGQTGSWTGDDLVNLILAQPATARFIVKKLWVYFAYEDPSPEVVDRLANVLRANGYELAPLLKHLFAAEEFYSAKAMGTQIKSPVQLIVGTLRTFGVKDANYGYLDAAVRNMGQDLLEPPNVKGWDGGKTWVDANRVFVRYNSIADLVETVNRPNNTRHIDAVEALAARNLQNASQVVDFLIQSCLVRAPNEKKRQGLIEFLGPLPPSSEWAKNRQEINNRLTALLVILMSMPEYQLT
jgi:hypothetical protein